MKPLLPILKHMLLAGFFLQWVACSSPVKEKNDSLYSRHLQRKVDLTIVSTPLPEDHSEMNLFILLTGTDHQDWQLKKIIDSLHKAKAIQPLLIVEVAGRSSEEFGLSEMNHQGLPGKRSVQFEKFIVNELYPFIKKKSSVRKFNAITIAGAGKAAISALDLAWHHDDKFSRVALFSPAWGDWRRNPADSSAVLEYLTQTRKRPKLAYWFYAGKNPDTTVSSLTKLVIAKLTNKSFISNADIQTIMEPSGKNDPPAWNNQLANCLFWTYGKK